MAPKTSIDAIGRNSEHLVELEEERLRDPHLYGFHEALYRLSQTPSNFGGEQTVQRTGVQQAPSRIKEKSSDSFLRFRDEWVRNRMRDIRRAGSISFNICSEDTASITALNEFYTWRVFDAFEAEFHDDAKSKIEMMQDSRDFESLSKDVAAAGMLHMSRNVCREKGRRVFSRTCRRRAKIRV